MDVTESTFEADVIDRSHELPVLVDFWAEWCGPCRQLGPLLEEVVGRRAGEVVLAKVDVDRNPSLAQRYRVSSIPAVKAFKDGRVAEEFVGLLPPARIEVFINGLVPSQADRLVAIGDEASLREALVRDAGHVPGRLALGRLLIADGRSDEALEVLEPARFDAGVAGLIARLDLTAIDSPDIAAGLAALEREDWDSALRHLIDAVATAPAHRDAIRATVVGVFAQLGDQHPLTIRYRRRLARAFY